MWDCRICKDGGLDKTDRLCLLGKERGWIEKPFSAMLSRNEIVALADYEGLLDSFVGEWGRRPEIMSTKDRIVCPIALIDPEALQLLRLEGDTSQGKFPTIDTAWMRGAFRVIRDARAEAQDRIISNAERNRRK